jgi:hypothetical protein
MRNADAAGAPRNVRGEADRKAHGIVEKILVPPGVGHSLGAS